MWFLILCRTRCPHNAGKSLFSSVRVGGSAFPDRRDLIGPLASRLLCSSKTILVALEQKPSLLSHFLLQSRQTSNTVPLSWAKCFWTDGSKTLRAEQSQSPQGLSQISAASFVFDVQLKLQRNLLLQMAASKAVSSSTEKQSLR